MESINEFFKGLDTDTAPDKIPPGFMRDASNIRLINNEGQGLVVVNINGNEFRFSLKNGYVPLGYCVYNSIAYIFSTNGSNGEVGCYPAPDGAGSFPVDINGNPTYRALQNWTGAISNNPFVPGSNGDFNTSLFNFSKSHQIQCVARIDYDNSVNIYFTDNNNQFRVVNSGFDQKGNYVSSARFYWTGNFNQVNVFLESTSPPVITSMIENSGGSLNYGNYFFFLRYSTSSLNKTSFIGQSNAVEIPNAATNAMQVDGGPGGSPSTYEAVLTVNNIDPSYDFIEIAVVYYNQGTSSVYLIDNQYTINGLTTMTITINGNEDQTVFTMAQIQQGPAPWNVCKTLTQLEDRLWIANLSESNPITPALITFANKIVIGFDNTTVTMPDKPFAQSDGFSNGGQYKFYGNTYNNVGYFRGETYPFAIVFVFTDGTESIAIPCQGVDDWNPGAPVFQNPKGIFRFPANQYSPFATSTPANRASMNGVNTLNVMGVTFDWALAGPIPANVIGWYFVRGERKPNLIYQGIVVPCAKAIPVNSTTKGIPIYDSPGAVFPNPYQSLGILDYYNNHPPLATSNFYAPGSYYIPVFDCYIPFTYYKDPPTGSSGDYNRIFLPPLSNAIFTIGGTNSNGLIPSGFYSPDHFFTGIFSDRAYMVHTIGRIHTTAMDIPTLTDQSGYHAADMMFETLWMEFPNYISTPKMQCDNIPGFTPGGNTDSFTSCFNDGHSDSGNDPNCFLYYKGITLFKNNEVLTNRAFETNRYIGMLAPPGSMPYNISSGRDNISIFPYRNNGFDQYYPLANIYQYDPAPGTFDITTLYNPTDVVYQRISSFIKSNYTNLGQPKTLCYDGDCFLQRTYIKQLYNPDNVDSDIQADSLGGGVLDAFGIIFSVITENNINTAMRIQDLQNLYYPKTGLNAALNDSSDSGLSYFGLMASNNNDPESNILNTGYNQTLSGYTYEGFDVNIPFQETQFPTRIAYSEFHPNGSFTDFYRIFDAAAFQDYDYRLGEITDILAFHSRLVSVQESGVNFHLVNERALQNSSSAGDILIGTGTVLDAKAQVITDVYGSQHQWSILQTDYNLYGFDFNKRKIWRIKPTGEFENISDTKNITSWISTVFQPPANPESAITNTFPDNPINLQGILSGYDRKYGDVIFTILGVTSQGGNESDRPEDSIVYYSDSMCFSEKMDEFTNRPQYNSPFYLSLNNDFFSINPNVDHGRPGTISEQNFYVHDVAVTIGGANNLQTFYSVLQKSFIVFIHNENSDSEKIYSNLKISSGGNEFSNIIYTTEQQTANNLTFTQPLATWIDPRFRENVWMVPVARATAVNNTNLNPNLIGSVMRGKWLQCYLEFNQNIQQYVKSVKMYFRISY